jgi:hypothetical protein
MSIWYQISSKPIPIKLSPKLKKQLKEEIPTGLEFNDDFSEVRVEHDDEGFMLEEVEAYLKCATERGRFRVHMDGKEGMGSFDVCYGPGICREE